MRIQVAVMALLLTGCSASGGARSLKGADMVAHLSGLAEKYPEAHEELHKRLEELEEMEEEDPEASLGLVHWGTIIGSIGAAVLGLNHHRNRKYKIPVGTP